MSVTPAVSQLEMSYSNSVAPGNMADLRVTIAVSQPEILPLNLDAP